ncbi:MAG: MarR family transcriptional regulator [Dermatophilaceae bacterium]
MKDAAPALLPLLRSRAQGDIIAWIVLHPDQEYSLAEIGRAVGVSGPTVMREVGRLAEAGLVREVRRGNQRLVRADTDNAVYAPLASLMSVTFGPVPVLRELLAPVAGVREAWVYGSWAARYAQQPGPVPGDIDVLVVGTVDPDVLDDVARVAALRLGREVNIRRVRPSAWDNADADPFKATVTSRPMVALMSGDRGRA